MSISQRNKGKRGERELALELSSHIGIPVKRRVRSTEGDSDLDGVRHWSVECKRCQEARIPEWWRQTVEQAQAASEWPVLFYRLDGKKWRVVWPLAATQFNSLSDVSVEWFSLDLAVESTIEGWATVYRNVLSGAIR